MTGWAGVRMTDNFVANQRPKNWREGTLLLFPNGMAPLYALSAGAKSESTDDPEYNWWEKAMLSQRIAIATDLLDGTTITLPANAARDAGWRVGDIILVEETGELMRCEAPNATSTTATVERGLGAVGKTTVDFDGAAVNPNLVIVGSQFEENSAAPVGASLNPVKKVNYTQIFRTTFEASRTAIKSRLRTGDAVREAKREVLQYHSAAIEKAFFWGEAEETTVGGEVARRTGGVYEFIGAGNTHDFAGDVQWDTLLPQLEKAFRFGSSQKFAFCGNLALLSIQEAIRLANGTTVNIMHGDKAFGMDVTRLMTPFGELVLKTHPLFNQQTSVLTGAQTYRAWDGFCTIIDMENVRYRYLKDSDTQYQPKLQDNGLDGIRSGYLSEVGLELHHPDTHFDLRGMTAGSAG